MKIKWIKDLDYDNYKNPSMFIGVCECDWKCCVEQNIEKTCCWNNDLYDLKATDISSQELYERYIKNKKTKAIVIGGFEPFLQIEEIIELIEYFRKNNCNSDFVIYTGYYEHEIEEELKKLKRFKNIIIKFGRFKQNENPHYDKILGLYLSNESQYAKRIC